MTDQDGDYHMANVDDIDFSQKKKKRRIPTTSNLHRDGWHALRSRPDWSVLAFCEAQHDQWCQRAIDVLQSLSHTWDDSEYPNQRPGEVTAVEANRILHGEGAKVWISTTHPSVEQFYPYAITGPRWYCSIIQAARSGGGCCLDSGDAPRPPYDLQQLLWPEATDGSRPWITELGWTLVPGGSHPQCLHADIVRESFFDEHPRETGRGRFHHIAWKSSSTAVATAGTPHCTTEVVAGAFTNGDLSDEAYEQLACHRSACLVLDSEMLHRGGPTPGPISRWSSTCTIQICSTSGWSALQCGGRCSKELLKFTIPIAQPADATGGKAAEGVRRRPLHIRFEAERAEAGTDLTPSTAADSLSESAGSSPRSVLSSARATPDLLSFSGDVSGGGAPFMEGLVRDAKSAECNWAATAEARARVARKTWAEALPPPSVVGQQLSSPGWWAASHGLPREWAWEVFSLVEALHERYAPLISELLASELNAEARQAEARKAASLSSSSKRSRCASAREASTCASASASASASRPGEAAAAATTRELKRRGVHGVAVYAPPPSQSQEPPYSCTGPRFYVSATELACTVWSDLAPPMPPALRHSLWPHGPDASGVARVRGLGWALAPPDASPQSLHADIWGYGEKVLPRFPHIVWKPGFGVDCTTQLVPNGFTWGAVRDEHYAQLRDARAPALIFDSEILHRGAQTPAALQPRAPVETPYVGLATAGWVSSCSVELCSVLGWTEWQSGTGGTEFSDEPEYRMLPIRTSV